MPHVKIVNATGHGHGTYIEIDGVPMPRVRDIQFHAGMSGPVTITLEVLPASIEIDTLAEVGYGHAV